MRRAFILLLAAVLGSSGLMAISLVQDRGEMRKNARTLLQDNHFAEALQLFTQLVRDQSNSDADLPQDFSAAITCLNQLHRIQEFDALLEDAVTLHANNWRLLHQAAGTLSSGEVPSEGFLIAGLFERGYHRGGGRMVSSADRDRVRALQILLQALPLVDEDVSATEQDKGKVYKSLADLIGSVRFQAAWKLQDLTDLTTLPDYEEGGVQVFGRGIGMIRGGGFPIGSENKGAPVDADGDPVFHQLPASWDTAASDGERWRWAMDQVVRQDASRRSEMDLEWAAFLQSQFGVSTAVVGGPPVIRADAVPQPDDQTPATTYAAHELDDSETIARLTTGIRRFQLPAEFNHLTILKRIIARNDGSRRTALESLINERMNRHQYAQAAELLTEMLPLAANDNDRQSIQARIDQILKNWMQFESLHVQPAGTGATIDIRFRNGSEITFEARPINLDLLLQDLKAWLQSRPNQIQYDRLQLENIGYRLLNEDQQKYLGQPAARWTLAVNPPDRHFDAMHTVTTPLQQPGAWWLTARINGGNESRVVVWVADTAITRKRIEQGTLYYVADAVTGAGIPAAEMEFFGWRQERIDRTRSYQLLTRRFADRCDNNGLCIPAADQLNPQFQWLAIARTANGRLAYDGFTGIWNPERIEPFSYSPIKVYTVTDRPVYRPGHSVKFRLWVRQPRFTEDDARFANQEFIVEIRSPKGDVIEERKVRSDQWAGIDGEWLVPMDATLGSYQLRVCEPKEEKPENRASFGVGQFRVEEYRKPEFEVTVDAPDRPIMLGEKVQATVRADYYFGAPVAEGSVKYKVERTKKDSRWYPVARWDWLYAPGYWWFAPEYSWYPGWNHWGCIPPIPPWRGWNPDPPELIVDAEAELAADGTFVIDIDTADALRNHSDSDHNYTITAEVVDQSRRTIIGTGSVLVARQPFRVFVWTDRGHYQTGDTVTVSLQARTADGKPVQATGTASLRSVTYNGDQPVEQEVQAFEVTTNADGTASLKLVMPAAGQFRVSVSLTDAEGHTQEGGYVLFVRGPAADGRGYRFNDIELITDKREYQPGDKAVLQINTNKANSTVLLFVRPANGLCPKPQIVRMPGKSTTIDLAIDAQDMPNIFVEALTIADGRVHSEVRELVVPPEQRVATVEVLPSAERYRPGDTATVRLKLTDLQGRPFVGNTVLSVYDASLEYIAANTIPEIRSFFWNVRRYHHVNVQSTLQRSSGPVYRPDEIQMQPLFGTDPGISHDLFLGDSMMSRGGAMMRGAPAAMAEGAAMPMMAEEAAAPGFAAGMQLKSGVSADGDQPEVQPTVRSSFADTAHWTASAVSDSDGIVEVSFTVPDNLTTWKIHAWTLGDGTRVGSGSAEIISSKDLIIRPQTPRFFTETDLITVSAVVHNYLENRKSCRVILETEGGLLQLLSDAEQVHEIAAGGEVRVDWSVRVAASGTATIRMKALTDEESDAAEYTVPVHIHGMRKTESFTGVIRPGTDSAGISINVPAQRINSQSRLEIRYSPSLAGAMVDALPYLIDYPWGCTEQTLNRFLPAVITQQTLKRMGIQLDDVRQQRTNLNAQQTYLGKYPAHWGQPPEIQTRDIRPLPAGFGMGSSTLAAWIQEKLDADARVLRGRPKDYNPVFDEAELNRIVRTGVTDLTNMQLSDGGWGWFSGFGERSSAHLTSQVVHGLTLAQKNGVPILPDVLQRGVDWLKNHQAEQVRLLQEGDRRKAEQAAAPASDPAASPARKPEQKPFKMQADNMDAFVAFVLSQHGVNDTVMTDYLFRDRGELSVYAKALTGLVLEFQQDVPRRDLVLRNIEQFLEQDDQNQTAWLRMPENSWWYWYGSENEAMARYLQLLLKVDPRSERASRLVKYLLNNRRHGSYWNSTRDTALVVEAMADFLAASGEDKPDMTIEVLVDGQVQKSVKITSENFFSFDSTVLLEGDAVTTGTHQILLRRSGSGPVYFSAFLTNFTQEDQISAAGLEVSVQRQFYLLKPVDSAVSVQGDRGQVVRQQVQKYERIPLNNFDSVTSGQLVEVELLVNSRNDYEYLMLADRKPSGFETDDQRSGYVHEGLSAYRELRDDRVTFFLSQLARGHHSISYRLRAETPAQQVAALPAVIEGMYSPDLVGNSDEIRLRVNDRK